MTRSLDSHRHPATELRVGGRQAAATGLAQAVELLEPKFGP